MTYQPQPGTIAYRAIQWLKTQPEGTQVTASVWAEAIDTDGATLITCLATAVSSGLVLRHKRPDNVRLVWWSLGDGNPPEREPEREPEVLPRRSEAPDVKPQLGAIFPGGVRGSEPVPPAPAPKPTAAPVTSTPTPVARPATPAKPTAFDVWFSGVSGELVIQGAHVDTDGDVVLPKEQVRQLLAALSGVAA